MSKPLTTSDAHVASTGPAEGAAVAHLVKAASRDINSRGKVLHRWYRMVYRDGQWRYFAEEREPRGTFLAAERRWVSGGYVYAGELVCQHDYGGPVVAMCEVGPDGTLNEVPFRVVRSGLAVTRMDGTEVILPDPRRRS